MNKDIDVFILCGGLGKRLGKISGGRPKPMVNVAGKPFLYTIISWFKKKGFKRFIIGTGHKADFIKAYYASNPISGISVRFSEEKQQLGTGGAVKNARRLISSNPFFVLNGDSYCRFSPDKFLLFHKKNKSIVSIVMTGTECGMEYGKIKVKQSGQIDSFDEKDQNAKNCFVNAGVYLFDKKAFDVMPCRRKFSLERDFFPRLKQLRSFGYKQCDFFIDIGTPERYVAADRYFSGKRAR